MLNIINHKGNAHQNRNEIPPHTRMGYSNFLKPTNNSKCYFEGRREIGSHKHC